MKSILFNITFLIIIAGCSLQGQQNDEPKSQKSFPVLFAVTGYGSPDSSISMKLLFEKIKSDSLNTFILSDIFNAIDSLFNIEPKAIPVEDWENIPANDSLLFITDVNHLLPEMRTLRIDSIDFFNDPENYPLSFQKIISSQIRDRMTLMVITGVTAIARAAGTAADINGVEFLTKNLKPYFEDADFVHISNEVSFCKNCQYTAGMSFCTKEEHFKALLDLNCNIVELTGNHNRDYGDVAFRETLKWYKQHNIKLFGGGDNPDEANTPLVLSFKDSTKLGFIGFNEFCPNGECADIAGECGANRYDSIKAAAVLAKMKNELNCDFIIASVQFGESDASYPTPTQKKKCDDLLSMGADMVYGSQAHQAQQLTFIHHKPVFYGLGNFIFDQIHRIGVRQAFFLQLYFYKGKLIQARPVLTFMQTNRQQHIANKDEAALIRKAIYHQELIYPEK